MTWFSCKCPPPPSTSLLTMPSVAEEVGEGGKRKRGKKMAAIISFIGEGRRKVKRLAKMGFRYSNRGCCTPHARAQLHMVKRGENVKWGEKPPL